MSAVEKYLSEASFDQPEYLVHSTWMEHGPFAFWLVEAARPSTIVELGVFRGYSYFCFNQAVKKSNLQARTFGIDTWEGDEHGGFYSDEIYNSVKAENDRYSASSSLIRTTFAQALDYIEDNSIDILHIDGRHFEEDVWEDFNNWKPKLSERAIVLFHDTRVYDRNFGVHKVWRELAKTYPHIEFNFGCGLGVLGFGKRLPEKLTMLFSAPEEEKAAVQRAYARLGAGVLAHFDANKLEGHRKYLEALARDEKAKYEAEAARVAAASEAAATSQREIGDRLAKELEASDRLAKELDAAELKLSAAEAAATSQREIGDRLAKELDAAELKLSAAEAAATSQREIGDRLAKGLDAAELKLSAALSAVDRLSHEATRWAEYARRGEAVLRLEAELREERQVRAGLLASTSWRATSPLRLTKRVVSSPLRAVRALFRRMGLLATKTQSVSASAPELGTVRAAAAPDHIENAAEASPREVAAPDHIENAAEASPREVAEPNHIENAAEASLREVQAEAESNYLAPEVLAAEQLIAPFFDNQWYQDQHPELANSNLTPAQHYLVAGEMLEYDPSPAFSVSFYLKANPDVAASGASPFQHFIKWGANEFRMPSRRFSLERYARKHGLSSGLEAFSHYLTAGDSDDLAAVLNVVPEEALEVMGHPANLRGPIRVVVGIVISYESQSQIDRIIKTTRLALARCDAAEGSISIFDNGNNGVFVDRTYIPGDIKRLSVGRGIGFANGHNHLMKEAFEGGAEVYITANPDGAFHPDCITYLLTMNQAHEGGALLEAIQFPEEHPKFYSPKTLETPWVSGACLLISQRAYDAIGGFDPHIFLYCDDVDISWEAHYRGIKTLICPRALFYHDVSGRTHSSWRYREMLISGRYLGHKWGSPEFMQWAEKQLLDNGFAHSRDELPSYDDVPIDSERKRFSDFSRGFSFSSVRW